MNKVLDLIWKRADLEDHFISDDEIRRWKSADREQLFSLGLLRRMEDADCVPCTACSDPHEEEVFFLPGSAGQNRQAHIRCPEVGIVPVPLERLQRWEVDFPMVVKSLATSLGIQGTPVEVVPGRIWLLGRRRVSERAVEFFLVRGIAWADSAEILQTAPRLQNSPAPIILCPNRLPEAPQWQQNGRALFSLRELVRIENSQLSIRSEDFEDLHRQIAGKLEEPITPTPVNKRAALIEDYCRSNNCRVKDVYYWSNVVREDLNKWKLGRKVISDLSEKAIRIEKLLQRGQKTRA